MQGVGTPVGGGSGGSTGGRSSGNTGGSTAGNTGSGTGGQAGGTGGGVYPALVVRQALGGDADPVLWVGSKGGMEAEGNSPQEFAEAIRREVDQWKKLVKAAGIRAQ